MTRIVKTDASGQGNAGYVDKHSKDALRSNGVEVGVIKPNIKDTADTKKAIQQAFDNIVKEYGAGAVMRLGDKPIQKYDVIDSGCMSLNIAFGVGGYPRGRIVEIFGPESSGKSTLCLHVAAEAQKNGGTVAFIDTENALDLKYAQALGVNVSELLLSQPDYGEQALTIAEEWLNSGAIDLVIVDSVAALVPRSEIEGEMGAAQMGVQARLMSQAMRKLSAIVARSGAVLLFTNQLRSKIGVMFGSPDVTTGGNALKYYASLRLDIRRIETLKDGTTFIGSRTRVKVVKNKVAPPFREAEVDIIYGQGIDKLSDVIQLASIYKIIDKAGAWYSYNGEQMGQGKDQVKEYLLIKSSVLDEIKSKIMIKVNSNV